MGLVGGRIDRRRAARTGNFPGKRFEAGAKLGIGNLAQAVAQLLRHGRSSGRAGFGLARRRLALAENDPVDRPRYPKKRFTRSMIRGAEMLKQR